MSYAALMVHFDAAPSAYRRIHLAVDLANRFEATLIGIAGRSYVPTLMAEGLEIDAAGPDCEQDELDNLADLGREFRAAAKRVRHLEWRGRVEHASNLVSNEARAADLVVIGRDTGPDDLHLALDPGISILRAGRLFWLCRMRSICFRHGASCWRGKIRGSPAARLATHFRS